MVTRVYFSWERVLCCLTCYHIVNVGAGLSWEQIWICVCLYLCVYARERDLLQELAHMYTIWCLQARNQESQWCKSLGRPGNPENRWWKSRPESKELRTRSASVQGQKKMDGPALAKRANAPFLCLFILFSPSPDWVIPPTHHWQGWFSLLSLQIQMLTTSRATLTDTARENILSALWPVRLTQNSPSHI